MKHFQEAGMIKVPDRIHNNRSQELVLMVQQRISTDGLSKEKIEKAKRKAEETREFIYPIAEQLGGNYKSLLEASQLTFEGAIRELNDSV
jgi:(p)ppGpp synthase/HD superfamily hydrolase